MKKTRRLPTKPEDRRALLDLRRRNKMAESAHAYMRGNTAKFYEWIEHDESFKIPHGPAIWICGDCHIGNLGPVADLKGNVEIQLRDLDQTIIGNPSYDLLRLALSLAMAARSSDLSGTTTPLMIEVMLEAYIQGLKGHAIEDASTEATSIHRVMQDSLRRGWRHLSSDRIEAEDVSIPLGRSFWPLTDEERSGLVSLFEESQDKHLIRTLTHGRGDEPIKLLDGAYWIKGCSSLGRVRYAVLLAVGRKKSRRYRLMDVKEAVKALAPTPANPSVPENNAERVVAGARQLSPFLGDRMTAATLAGKPVVIRELRPQDLKFEFSNLTQTEAVHTARMLAAVVGKAHGRQMKGAQKSKWIRDLKTSYSKKLEAPSWLWNSVVAMVSAHESAYLGFCRDAALLLGA